MNKKSSLFDLILIPVLLLGAAFAFMIILTVSDAINTNFQDSSLTQAAKDLVDQGNEAVKLSDFSFVLIAFGLIAAVVVSGYLAPSHPIFFPIMIVLWGISVFLSGTWSNVYAELAGNPSMATALADLTYTNQLMTNLPIYTALVAFLTLIVTYGFRRKEGIYY
jgi:hypothetical protein